MIGAYYISKQDKLMRKRKHADNVNAELNE